MEVVSALRATPLRMRFEFDRAKSRIVKRKHGVGLAEALEIFNQAYIVDRKSDNPEQFRAIGLCGGRLCSVIFEIRHDADGEYSRKAMPKTSKTALSADQIAERASRGEDISGYLTNEFTVVRPVRRVNIDLTQGMLRELDERAARLNISRQAVIKTLLDRALEEERTRKARAKKNAS
jgi:uncharacterized DUF497 family protein